MTILNRWVMTADTCRSKAKTNSVMTQLLGLIIDYPCHLFSRLNTAHHQKNRILVFTKTQHLVFRLNAAHHQKSRV